MNIANGVRPHSLAQTGIAILGEVWCLRSPASACYSFVPSLIMVSGSPRLSSTSWGFFGFGFGFSTSDLVLAQDTWNHQPGRKITRPNPIIQFSAWLLGWIDSTSQCHTHCKGGCENGGLEAKMGKKRGNKPLCQLSCAWSYDTAPLSHSFHCFPLPGPANVCLYLCVQSNCFSICFHCMKEKASWMLHPFLLERWYFSVPW